MAEGNGNGRVNITGQMLLTALVALLVAWGAWMTRQAMIVPTLERRDDALERRIDGIVSTLSCTQQGGNKTASEGQ